MSAPAWRRQTSGEHRWPVTVAVVVTIGLQVVLPDKLVPQARYLLPALELVLLLGLVAANPYRLNRESAALRGGGLAMTGLIALSNAWSAVLLVIALVTGTPSGPI